MFGHHVLSPTLHVDYVLYIYLVFYLFSFAHRAMKFDTKQIVYKPASQPIETGPTVNPMHPRPYQTPILQGTSPSFVPHTPKPQTPDARSKTSIFPCMQHHTRLDLLASPPSLSVPFTALLPPKVSETGELPTAAGERCCLEDVGSIRGGFSKVLGGRCRGVVGV